MIAVPWATCHPMAACVRGLEHPHRNPEASMLAAADVQPRELRTN
jgi:hypothetical protein